MIRHMVRAFHAVVFPCFVWIIVVCSMLYLIHGMLRGLGYVLANLW